MTSRKLMPPARTRISISSGPGAGRWVSRSARFARTPGFSVCSRYGVTEPSLRTASAGGPWVVEAPAMDHAGKVVGSDDGVFPPQRAALPDQDAAMAERIEPLGQRLGDPLLVGEQQIALRRGCPRAVSCRARRKAHDR